MGSNTAYVNTQHGALRVNEFERELLSLPADVGCAVAYHRLYPRLLEAHFAIRRIGEPTVSKIVLEGKRHSVAKRVLCLQNTPEGRLIQKELSKDRLLDEFMVSKKLARHMQLSERRAIIE